MTSISHSLSRRAAAIGVIAAIGLAACSSRSTDTSARATSTTEPTTTTASPTTTRPAPDDAALLRSVLDAWQLQHPVTAGHPAAVAIARPGADPVVATSGTSRAAPVTNDDWFRIGSVTKTYVSVALLRLAEAGKIDLDAPIAPYAIGVPGEAFLTPRQLLSMTSGLPDYLANPAWLASVNTDWAKQWTPADALALVDPETPRPGTYEYSNTNYVVLGLIIEKITGESLRDALEALVLDPAHLSETDLSSAGHSVVDAMIDRGDGTLIETADVPSYTALETSAWAAGSIVATPADVARFGQALLDRSFVSTSAWAQMTTFNPDGGYGLGFADLRVVTNGQIPGVGNYGEIPGFGALLDVEPDSGIVMVAISADDRASGAELGLLLSDAVHASKPIDLSTPAAKTDVMLRAVHDRNPGCAISVTKDGGTVYANAAGLADVDTSTTLTADTPIDVGSASKQFTATAVLRLVEEGKVSLDAPLSTYLAGLPVWGSQVTVAQAMHHDSGIPDYIEAILKTGRPITDAVTEQDALHAISSMALSFPPGTRFEYSNSNYLLLAELVSEVTGRPFADVIDADVVAPAGIEASMSPGVDVPGQAHSYTSGESGHERASWPWTAAGDGGIKTSVTQLARWGSQYWSPTVGDASINELRAAGAVPTGEAGGERYGAGIRISTVDGVGTVYSHLGQWEASSTVLAVVPKRHLSVAASCLADDAPLLSPTIGIDLLRIWA